MFTHHLLSLFTVITFLLTGPVVMSIEQQKNDHSQLPLLEDGRAASVPIKEPNHVLDMATGEASIKMDHLGPVVVNEDGSLSRITNWLEMTQPEQANTKRLIAKRNAKRLEKLRGKDLQQPPQQGDESGSILNDRTKESEL